VTGAARRAIAVVSLALAIALGTALAAGGIAVADEAKRVESAAAAGEDESQAGGEHKPTIHPGSLGLQLLNFGVLLGLLVLLGGKAINKSLGARHEQLKSELASASSARAAAEESLRKQEERLKGLETEIADLRAGIKKEAEVEKTRLVAAAEERARRLLEETTFVIEQQTKEGQRALRREAAEAGLRIAEQLLRKSFGAADERRFLDGFVQDVSAGDGAGPSGAGQSGAGKVS
jgi:F-type H+-transporting ATPase subunit b